MTTFEIGAEDFLLDGQPHRILSGALHYFRVHPGQWADRIHAARLMGLNTIETYVAWNAHESVRGEWDATGANDLGAFLDLIAAEGMHAIVRPGPYICAEWTNGGLPAWLTAMDGIGLRRSEPTYLAELTTYLRHVYDIVVPRQIDRGGNVILVQIENEYGAYGADKEYLASLVEVTRAAGITVPLTTIDQPQPQMLRDGSLPGIHMTGSFGSRAEERLATLRLHQRTGPLMCAEFWDGWFDWWGGVHHATPAADSARELDSLLAAGASVNFYMVHGGTNFGLTSGANHKGRYLPITTSYDYDAPLDEAGRPTEKFWAFREVIARYAPVPDIAPGELPGEVAQEFEVSLEAVGDWLDGGAVRTESSNVPSTFDDLAHTSAVVVYEAALPAGAGAMRLEVGEVRDRAWIEVDGVCVGTLSRTAGERSLPISRGERLTIVVEERGRVNYADRLGEAKGLIGPVQVGGATLADWSITPIDVVTAAEWARTAPYSKTGGVGRVALRGTFEVPHSTALFLDTTGWGSGFAFINGFFLGRYDRSGPQHTLYVPGPAVNAGSNTIVVLELADAPSLTATFVATPNLGPLEE